MGRVALALTVHELVERTRDRWVLVISVLFAVLASGVSLYGREADAPAAVTGPSLVTLAALLVPLVAVALGHDAIVGERERNTLGLLLSLPVRRAEVVAAKFLGRFLALALAVGAGLGAAMAMAGEGQAAVLAGLIGPTLLLGAAFLSVGLLVSAIARRQVTAVSAVVALWFVLVLFWDLGLLGLLVATDGQVPEEVIAWAIWANPAGLFRVDMLARFAGPDALADLGLTIELPSAAASVALWAAWILLPIVVSGLLLSRRKVVS